MIFTSTVNALTNISSHTITLYKEYFYVRKRLWNLNEWDINLNVGARYRMLNCYNPERWKYHTEVFIFHSSKHVQKYVYI